MRHKSILVVFTSMMSAFFILFSPFLLDQESAIIHAQETRIVSDFLLKSISLKEKSGDVKLVARFVKAEQLRLEQERLENERLKQEKIELERLEKEEKQSQEERKKQELQEKKKQDEQKKNDSTQQNEQEVEKTETSQTKEKHNTATYQGISSFERDVVKFTNEERVKHGLPELKIDNKLSEVAWHKSNDMQVNNYFSHTSPTYGSPFDMMSQFGITYTAAGENIAMGYQSPKNVVEGWMNSEGHRKNILNQDFTHIGVGYVASDAYSTQLFIKK